MSRSGSRCSIFFFSSRRRHTRSVSAFLLNRSSDLGNKTTNLTSKEAKMGKVMRHTLGASLNIRHNLSSRSEERFSRNAETDLVCRLLLEKKNKIAERQLYRYAPSYVSPAYHLLEGFPFIQEPPSGDLQERVLIRHHDYDQCFQSVQLLQWNSQVKFNVTVYRNLPTTRDSIMTS